MALSIFDICRFILLLLNAMAIVSERRILSKYGILPPNYVPAASSSPNSSGTQSPSNVSGIPDFTFGNDFTGNTDNNSNSASATGGVANLKQQVGQLLFSVRLLLRWPIVIANLVMIVLTVIFG